MPKFVVKFSGLADMLARVEVEAETAVAAVEAARHIVEDDRGAVDWEPPDEGLSPNAGTEEPYSVEDEDGEEVLELSQVSGAAIADLISGAKAADTVKHIAALDDLRTCAAQANAFEQSEYGTTEPWDEAMDAAKAALARSREPEGALALLIRALPRMQDDVEDWESGLEDGTYDKHPSSLARLVELKATVADIQAMIEANPR